jgi:hypothetical protein
VYHQRKKKKNTIFILIKLNVDNIHSTNFSLLEHEKYIAQDGKNCQNIIYIGIQASCMQKRLEYP